MSVIQICFVSFNFDNMKTFLRISALFSLLLMISMTGFCQGGTVAMKFSPHPLSMSPYQAIYYIWNVTTQNADETSTAQFVSPTLENTYQFNTQTLNSNDTYRFVAYVWDSAGYSGWGSSATFTGAQYNSGGTNFKKSVDVIYLN